MTMADLTPAARAVSGMMTTCRLYHADGANYLKRPKKTDDSTDDETTTDSGWSTFKLNL